MYIPWIIIAIIVIYYFWEHSTNEKTFEQVKERLRTVALEKEELKQENAELYKKVRRATYSLNNLQDHINHIAYKYEPDRDDFVDAQQAANTAISFFEDEYADPEEYDYTLKKPC